MRPFILDSFAMAIQKHMLQYAQNATIESSNLTDILAYINALRGRLSSPEMKSIKPDFLQTLCGITLKKMSEVPVPREAENIQQQNMDTLVIIDFFRSLSLYGNEFPNIVSYVLATVYETITREQEVSPLTSLGLAVIPDHMIASAVNHIFSLNRRGSNESKAIINAVKRLITWQKTTHYNVPLHLWIVKVLSTLHDEKQYDILEEIIFENIEKCYLTLIVPVFQATTFAVVRTMLECQHSMKIFNGKLKSFINLLPSDLFDLFICSSRSTDC